MDSVNPLSDIRNAFVTDSAKQFRSPAKQANESQAIYKDLLAKGKTAAAVGNLNESLEAYQKAYKMKPTEKILQRIKKIEEVIQEMGDEDDNDDFVQLDNGLIIFKRLVERLYPHQIEGVKWIYDLQKKRKKGGILADDMGLGKTIQVISALSAMFDMEIIRSVLLVLPLSLIPNWQKEFEKWAPGIKLKSFYGSAKERSKNLDYAQRRPAVCITTYGLVVTQWEQLGQTKFREEFTWDYIILDEGHKIKNPSKTTKGLHAIPSKNRLILTGTPIQNNLRELWALFDWVTQGTLLGTQKTFKMEYETPITRARQRGASSAEIHLGNYMAESLRKIVDPFILRRTKGSVSAPKPDDDKVDANQSSAGPGPSFPKLKKKNDFVIWTYLSEVQEEIYRDFLAQDSIKELLASKRSPLVYLTILKKICDHPRLLPRRACHQLGLEANDSLHEDDFHTEKGKECAANRIDNISDQTLVEESGKLQFLLELLKRLRDEGHRTLIFSLSRKVLNIVHRILLNNRFKVMRLDGTITKLSERELRVKKFQQDSSYEVFLLTTQVGGVGLTLTAADRVVIFDPSWNPATDAQAVDRIYRIGQDKNVVVYRLITCGTVEEKIYRRQIFKDSIIKQSTGDNKDPYRYFTNHDLKELFQLENTRDSMTQRQLQDLHREQRCLGPELEEHLAYLHTLSMFGVSDHDLMFSQDPDDVDGEVMDEHKHAIQNKVEEARSRVELEAKAFSGNSIAEQRWGEFDIRSKVSEPRIKEEEPKYEIEGLYDKLDSLKMEDDAVENIFNQSMIPSIPEPSQTRKERESTLINVPDSDDEDAALKPQSQNEAILVEDSPEIIPLKEKESDDTRTLEIGESFISNLDSPNKLRKSMNRTSLGMEGLLENNISCIPIPRYQDPDISKKNENPVENLPKENDFVLDRSCAEADAENSGNLPNESARPTQDENEDDRKGMDADRTHSDNDGREDSTMSEDDLALLNFLDEASTEDLGQYGLEKSPKHVDESLASDAHSESKLSSKPEESVDENLEIDDDNPLADNESDAPPIQRFSPLEEDISASPSPKVLKLGEVMDASMSDYEDERNLEESEDERSLYESRNDSPKGFFVDGGTPLVQSTTSRKKRLGRLISDSDASTEGEDVQSENTGDETEEDHSDAGSLRDFIVDDDENDGADLGSPVPDVGKDLKKAKRRSTAVHLPDIDTSDESSDEREDTNHYRDRANTSSETENSRLSALHLSFQSDDDSF